MATSRQLCFLDQDGVLADFVGGACRVHGKCNPFVLKKNLGQFELVKLWNMTEAEFWKPIDATGEFFWTELEPTAEAKDIVDLAVGVFGLENVAVLTAPSSDLGCVPGKRAWMKRWFPKLERKMIFANASNKHFLAGPGRFLVDDRDSNIEDFTASGGTGILVPRPWNKDHDTDAVIETVRGRLYDSAVQFVSVQTQRAVFQGGLAAAPVARTRHGVRVSADSLKLPDTRQAATRNRGRGVAGDDYCLLCCATCGAVFDTRKLHQCHPDAGNEAGPRC